MSEVLDFYRQEALACQSLTPWLANYQQASLGDLARYGFPSRKVEDWKYTLLDGFLKTQFVRTDKGLVNQVAPLTCSPIHIPGGLEFTIVNGQFLANDEVLKQLPEGVLIKPLFEMISDHEALIKPYLGQILHHEHAFHALNSAMLHDGLVIYLPKGVHLEAPIVIRHWQDKANQAVYLRHLMIAEPGSHATVIEEFSGSDEVAYCTNSVTEIALAARAKLTHYKIQCESRKAFHLGHVVVRQGESSEFFSHSLSLGGQLVRSDLTISLQEKNACCLLNGIYLPDDNQHIDHHTRVNHDVADCISEQDYKGILQGRSRAVFNGQVFVAHDAQKTKANQQNKNLLLSAEAEIDTKPQLEIFADDVVCSHGATVGQLDDEATFYLSSRGLDEAEVTRYLIQAFISNNMQLIESVALHDGIIQLINDKLRNN